MPLENASCVRRTTLKNIRCCYLSTNSCGILYAILFNWVNAIGNLLDSILAAETCKSYDGTSAALRRVRVETVDDIILNKYPHQVL